LPSAIKHCFSGHNFFPFNLEFFPVGNILVLRCDKLKIVKLLITQPNKNQVIFFLHAKLNFFHRFSAVNTVNIDSVLSFFPASQVYKIILNESCKSPENALKRYNKIFPKIQIIRVLFVNKCSFQNWFISGILGFFFIFFLLHLSFNFIFDFQFSFCSMSGNFQAHVSSTNLILSS
jgi:hypothetical protein